MLKLRQALAYTPKRQGEIVITPKMKRRIKRELSAEKPTVWVGKEGATPQIVNEISRQLDKREIVKAKILRSALKDEEAKSVASKIAQQTNSSLIEVRGHTFLLYKRREKR
ncbi:MAG: YhbY family RNA-binding protein [Candidatus Bathyarchaeota archaeon]|nr:YhbY family RNA-binding protein [Candidatus Bathyarchaeota archaeon]MDH5418927.1 YhbY family RNA-binding protein [Candidatus Bathyarchaeota archaeon]MDH5635793.1 YhbY family RNA-binding protein [Candidatus Bathyarchaeota archaeon]